MTDLIVIALSMVPLSELRASLPLALQVYHLSDIRALVDVYLGTALPVLPLLFGLRHFIDWSAKHSALMNRLLEKFFRRTEEHLKGKYQRYGVLALFLWVASTIPPTGVWSASVAAVLFGVRPKVAAPAIFSGLLVAELIVFLLIKGLIHGLHL